VVGDSGTIIRTTGGGATWAQQTSGTTNFLRGVYFTDASTGTVVGCDGTGAEGTILRTTNGGATWVNQPSGSSYSLRDVFFTDVNTGTVVGARGFGGDWGEILRTTDGGETWTIQLTSYPAGFHSIFFTDANSAIAAGGKGWGDHEGEIISTTDGGATWVSQLSVYPSGLYSVFFTDASNGTVVGANGTILRTTTGGVPWIKDDQKNDGYSPQHFILSPNYPNPFNPTTTIEFDLPKSSEVRLKIFNILGEEVVKLVSDRLSAGSYSYEWDASSLASGVYIYRLEAEGFVQTRKMVLMK
jgi:photosystem II stability/assembly factor-like uncharacterized protein